MTLAPGRKADRPMPEYRTGCKPGHAPLRLSAGRGEARCLKCGREDPPDGRLSRDQLAALAGRSLDRYRGVDAAGRSALAALDEAVAQTALKLRALAVLEGVDPLDLDAYPAWLTEVNGRRETVDELLRARDEDEVRWAVRAAYV